MLLIRLSYPLESMTGNAQVMFDADTSYIGKALLGIAPHLTRLLPESPHQPPGRGRRPVNDACIDRVFADAFIEDLAKLSTTDYAISSWHVAALTIHDTMLKTLGMQPQRAHDAVCAHLSASIRQVQALMEDGLIHGQLQKAKKSFGSSFDLEAILPDAYAIIGDPNATGQSSTRSLDTSTLLHEPPMVTARNLSKFVPTRCAISINIANLEHAVLSMVYLYRALRQFGSEQGFHWEDMDFVISEQSQESAFVSEATDIQGLARHLSLALGASLRNFAASRKSGAPSIPKLGNTILEKAKRIPLAASHIRAQKNVVNFNFASEDDHALVEAFFQGIAKACDQAEGRQSTHVRTPAELCSAFNKVLVKDSLGLNFDYTWLWATCYRFVQYIRHEYPRGFAKLHASQQRTSLLQHCARYPLASCLSETRRVQDYTLPPRVCLALLHPAQGRHLPRRRAPDVCGMSRRRRTSLPAVE